MAGGRPTTYNEEIIAKAYDYLENCPDVIHTVVGLCIHMGRAKSLVYQWIKQDDKVELSDIVAAVNELQEQKLILGSITNDLNASISKMMLSKHGHVEIKEVDNKSSDGTMTPTKITRVVIDEPTNTNA
jgi:hypothetical protein